MTKPRPIREILIDNFDCQPEEDFAGIERELSLAYAEKHAKLLDKFKDYYPSNAVTDIRNCAITACQEEILKSGRSK